MLFDQKPLDRFELVNIVVPASSTLTEFYFPDLPQLRTAKIQAISFYCDISTMTKDINNVNLITVNDATATFLTLYSGNKEAIQNLPLYKLINTTQGLVGNNDGLFQFDNLVVDFSKSYVQFANTYVPTSVLPYSFNFGVYYIK
jgi:hypothetical protein